MREGLLQTLSNEVGVSLWSLPTAMTTVITISSLAHHSVRFGHMSVHIEVPGDLGQGQLHAIKLPSEEDLASQAGVFLQHGRHVQHVVLS